MRSTYTYVTLEVSSAAYQEIKALLEKAGYQHAFHEDRQDGVLIDMHGLALKEGSDGSASAASAGRANGA